MYFKVYVTKKGFMCSVIALIQSVEIEHIAQ